MYYLTSNEWIHKILLKQRKKISFINRENSVLIKYEEIWNKIKKTLSIKFHNMSVYDENLMVRLK